MLNPHTIKLPQAWADRISRSLNAAVTVFICAICVVLFIGVHSEWNPNTWDAYAKWGAPTANQIWNGAWWGLVTSNFFHVEIWHIGFNLYWFWKFGRKIESESTKLFFVLVVASSAIMSSLGQLAFSGTTGIGLSGVVYALFGYAFIKSKTDPAYAGFLDKKTMQLFFVWLLICIGITYAGILSVGNAAHITGMLWGMGIAYLSRFASIIRLALPLVILGLSSATLFWAPWSTEWLNNKAYNLHTAKRLAEAEATYRQVLAIDKDNQYARANLKLILLDGIMTDAYNAHTAGHYSEARKLYEKILSIDSANQWARQNKAALPPNTQDE